MSDSAEHCKDCCCARAWEALGINTYTGKSIPEHIAALLAQREGLLEALKEAKALCVALRKGGPGDYSKRWIESWLKDDVKPALEFVEAAIKRAEG